MKKICLAICILSLFGCAKHDPILPGTRTPIFDENVTNISDTKIDNLPDVATASIAQPNCPYVQDSSNIIWDGDKKIFSGFPTTNSVHSSQKPVCVGKYVIAGLTTGEVVKVNPKNRDIIWIADVFRQSNMTGGASVLDIVAPIIATNDSVYVGGMGDAFCRLNLSNGAKKWCTEISINAPFIIAAPAAFVIDTNGVVYALRITDGAIYWQTKIDKCDKISYEKNVITACGKKIDAKSGKIIK